MRWGLPLLLVVAAWLLCVPCLSDPAPRWALSRFFELPLTWDGGHLIEGTAAAAPWSWHARIGGAYLYDVGTADQASQARAGLAFGLGLPHGLEVALALPLGWTFGARQADPRGVNRTLVGMGEDGPGVGDLRLGLLWNVLDASRGGLGLLVGLTGTAPTGDHERLLGEGGAAADPFVSLAFQVLSSRLLFNLGYRLRPEHVSRARSGSRFEQDDDLVWRVGLRVPRKNDVAWSFEAEGTIGVQTEDGLWPASRSRPVWLGAGVDFPLSRLYRLGLFIGVGPAGEVAPDVGFGLSFVWQPVLPDEDGDGVGGASDDCPLLAEDRDGYEDQDGCPDLDNDRDGFPDDEDHCPLAPASQFSEDGC